MEHRMYEDLLKRLHAQELKMRRYHNIVGQPTNRPLSLAGEAAAAIEAGSEKEIGPPMAALRCSALSSAADVRSFAGPGAVMSTNRIPTDRELRAISKIRRRPRPVSRALRPGQLPDDCDLSSHDLL
jgi:hypothetical protein